MHAWLIMKFLLRNSRRHVYYLIDFIVFPILIMESKLIITPFVKNIYMNYGPNKCNTPNLEKRYE